MRTTPFFLILGNLIIFLGFCSLGFSEAPAPQIAPAYEPQKILIQFSPQLNIRSESQAQEILEKNLKKLNDSPAILNVKKIFEQRDQGPIFSFRLQSQSEMDIPALAQELQRQAINEILIASPNYKGKVSSFLNPQTPNAPNNLPIDPTDPFSVSFGSWGQSYADQYPLQVLNLEEAWTKQTGSFEVGIAIIDTGSYAQHPDLTDRIWKNLVELDGQPGLDDDQNGYIDDFFGFNFVGDGPGNPDIFDDHGHGTHVAGIIGAETKNGQYIAAVNWSSPLITIKSFNEQGQGTEEDVLEGLRYAIQHPLVKVINLSASFPREAAALLDPLIEQAYESKKIVVCPAGNIEGGKKSAFFSWPANNSLALTTGSTNHKSELSQFSREGLGAVKVVAPGGGNSKGLIHEIPSLLSGMNGDTSVNILTLASPVEGQEFRIAGILVRTTGTSLAAAFTSGVASLVVSQYSDISVDEVFSRIEGSALSNDLGNPGQDASFGYGLLNPVEALEPGYFPKTARAYISYPQYGQTISQADGQLLISGIVLGNSDDSYTYTLSWMEGDRVGDIESQGWETIAQGSEEIRGELGRLDLLSLTPYKVYTLRLKADNGLGVSIHFGLFELEE